MEKRPTYEQLEQRVKELEEKAVERKRTVEGLERFFELSLDMLCITGFDGYAKRPKSSI